MNLKFKSSLNVLDLMCILKEISKFIGNSYLNNVYQLSNSFFIFRFRGALRGDLVFEAGKRLNLTGYDFEKPKQPPSFCTFLRRMLNRRRLLKVSQHDFDRIAIFTFNSNFSLIFEFLGEGNLLLLDPSNMILRVLHPKKMRDRILMVNEIYKPPPLRGFNPLETTVEKLQPSFLNFDGKLVSAMSRFLNLSGELSMEICTRCGLNISSKASTLRREDLEAILLELKALFKSVGEGCLNPQIILKDERPISVIPFDFTIYNGYDAIYFDDYNSAVDEYFMRLHRYEAVHIREKVRSEVLGRFKAVLEDQLSRIKRFEDEAKRYRIWGNLIMNNLYNLQRIFQTISSIVNSGVDWKLFFERLKNDLPNNLKKIIYSFNVKDKILHVKLNGEVIPLRINISPAMNASRYFNMAKELEGKAERARVAMDNVKSKIEVEVERALRKVMVKPLNVKGVARRKRRWYENYLWFISSENFLVVAGRDASQNEALVRKWMNSDDIFVHADIHGGPATIILCKGRKPSEETIFEAAQMAVSFSKAWPLRFESASAYWVFGSQVSKKPPSGEYLSRGAFMIYGKRNYVKNIPLRVAVGIAFTEDAPYLISGPPSAISKHAELHSVLAPGSLSLELIFKKLKLNFLSKSDEKLKPFLKKLNVDDFRRLLPRGGFRIESKM